MTEDSTNESKPMTEPRARHAQADGQLRRSGVQILPLPDLEPQDPDDLFRYFLKRSITEKLCRRQIRPVMQANAQTSGGAERRRFARKALAPEGRWPTPSPVTAIRLEAYLPLRETRLFMMPLLRSRTE